MQISDFQSKRYRYSCCHLYTKELGGIMIRVLIADDELYFRNYMLTAVDWHSLGFQVCCLAQNGEEVLSELSKETIAALSDMEMRIHLEAMEETNLRNLVKRGVPEYYAHMAANSHRGYWFTANTGAVTRRITNERLTRAGFFELSPAYESIQSACIGRAVYRTVRMVR